VDTESTSVRREHLAFLRSMSPSERLFITCALSTIEKALLMTSLRVNFSSCDKTHFRWLLICAVLAQGQAERSIIDRARLKTPPP
jgi:hypothetical protein